MISCGVIAVLQNLLVQSSYSVGTPSTADSYFNQTEREASRGNLSQMGNYQQMMAGGSLAMYQNIGSSIKT